MAANWREFSAEGLMKKGAKTGEMKRNQPTPVEVRNHLLELIRVKFYPGEEKRFRQDRRLLLAWVVLWPASWLNSRAVTLPVGRYQEIVSGVILEASLHVTGPIKYPPAYLGKTVQSHFDIHGDEYYQEGKNVGQLADAALVTAMASGKALPVAQADGLRDMAAARDILESKKPVYKSAKKTAFKDQLTLL